MANKPIRLVVTETGAKKTANSIKGVDNNLKSMAKSALSVGAAYFGAQGLISAFSNAIEKAKEQELAEKKLETALGKSNSRLLRQASALQQVSVFGDEAIISQQAFLASLEFSEDQISQIIPVAMDLAAATGMTLESAVRNTAKTFSGLAGELGELVPQLRGLTKEQMMAGDAVKVMGDLFGGQATAQTETLAGSIDQMKNAMGDAAEVIGLMLAPALTDVAQKFTKFLGDFQTARQLVKLTDDEIQAIEKSTLTYGKALGQMQLSGTDSVENLQLVFTNLKNLLEQFPAAAQLIEPTIDLYAKAIEARKELAKTERLSEAKKTIEQMEKENEGLLKKQEIYKSTNFAIVEAEMKLIDIEKMKAENAEKEREANRIAFNEKQKQITAELKQAALVQGSAEDAMKAVVRAESMEAVAGLISSILKRVPFPLNTILAAGAGATTSKLIDKGLSKFATGGDFITDGPQMIMVGDNATGRERVQVTPLGTPATGGGQGGISINFNAPVTNDDYVRDFIIPEIQKATRMNLA